MKIQDILIKEQIKFIEIDSFARMVYQYTIDSKYKIKKDISKFLADQLKNPSKEIKKLAKSLKGKDQEETIINILEWVVKNIKYTSDTINFDRVEYWATAEYTIKQRKDDCDGMNALVYVLARLTGIGCDQLYCMIGNVSAGGHFWLTFWSTEHDKLVVIDATYYPSMTKVINRPRFTLTEAKYKKIWYLFNETTTLKVTK